MTEFGKAERLAHYRERAQAARDQAATMKDFEARQTMENIAALWEAMAAREERASSVLR